MVIRSEARWPAAESLGLVDAAAAAVRPDAPDLAAWYDGYASRDRARFAFDVDCVRRLLPPGGRIVEFGAVPPILTAALAKLPYDVVGVDIAPERFRSSIEAAGLDVRKADFEAEPLPFPDESFDAALFNEVFEHLRIDLPRTFREVRRVLKRGGLLLLSTPNLTSLSGWAQLVLKNRTPADILFEYGKLEKLGHMGHVRLYTPTEVGAFLHGQGFALREVIFRGDFASPRAWKRKIGNAVGRILPRLRPSFTIVAARGAN
jgi:SAM-dependent methyltransferase